MPRVPPTFVGKVVKSKSKKRIAKNADVLVFHGVIAQMTS